MGVLHWCKRLWLNIRLFIRIIGFLFLIIAVIGFLNSNQFELLKVVLHANDPVAITQYQLGHLSQEEFITLIEQELASNSIEDAQNLVLLAKDYNIQIPEALVARTEEDWSQSSLRHSISIANGFITGHGDDTYSLSAAIISDFTIVGDLRDLSVEGAKWLIGEDYDQFTLGIAAVGIALTLSSFLPVSAIVAFPARLGVSIIKAVWKAGKLSKPMIKLIQKNLAKAVNVSRLKLLVPALIKSFSMPSISKITKSFNQLDFDKIISGDFKNVTTLIGDLIPVDMTKFRKEIDGIVDLKAAGDLIEISKTTASIYSVGGLITAKRALEYVDNVKEIKKIQLLTNKFGNKTKTILKVFGKSAFKIFKFLAKLFKIVLAIIIWLIFALLYLIAFIRATIRMVKTTIKTTKYLFQRAF